MESVVRPLVFSAIVMSSVFCTSCIAKNEANHYCDILCGRYHLAVVKFCVEQINFDGSKRLAVILKFANFTSYCRNAVEVRWMSGTDT